MRKPLIGRNMWLICAKKNELRSVELISMISNYLCIIREVHDAHK